MTATLDTSFGFPTRARVVRPSISTLYITVIAIGVLGSMAWRVVSSILGPALKTELAPAFSLAWAAVAAGAVLVAVRRFGPAGLSRGTLTWCLGSPPLTGMMIRRSLIGRATVAALAGIVAGLIAVLVQPHVGWGWIVAAAAGGAVLALALTGLAAADQARGGAWAARAGAALAALGVLAWYAGAFDLVTMPSTVLPVASGAVLVLAMLGTVASAPRVLRSVRDGLYTVRELGRAGEVAERAGAATVMLTATPLARPPRRRRALRMPKRGRGRPLWITLVDLRRILARPVALLVLVAAVPLPGSVARAGHEGLAGTTLVLVAYAVLSRLAVWWRAWERSAALAAWLPFDDVAARRALLMAPLVILLVIVVAACLIARLPTGWVVSAFAGALFGGRRKIGAERASSDELWVTTPAGALPLNMMQKLVAGWDVALIVGWISSLVW